MKRELIGESVECPHCKKPNMVAKEERQDDSNTKHEFERNAAPSDAGATDVKTEKAVRPKKPTPWDAFERWAMAEPPKRTKKRTDRTSASWRLVGVICMAGGILSVISDTNSRYGYRFRSDNAIGAAANALERISEQVYGGGFLWVLVGAMFLILGAIFQLRSSIEDLAEAIKAAGKKDS